MASIPLILLFLSLLLSSFLSDGLSTTSFLDTLRHHQNHPNIPGVSTSMPMPVDLLKRRGFRAYQRHAAKEFLDAHNSLRDYFGEKPYIWNKTLATYARKWSKSLRKTCSMQHSGGPYGENLFWGTGDRWRAVDAVQNWALEHYYYDQNSNSCLPGRMCGHYTQIVWNSSVMIGCARVACKKGGVLISCNYDPPGNYIGESPFG